MTDTHIHNDDLKKRKYGWSTFAARAAATANEKAAKKKALNGLPDLSDPDIEEEIGEKYEAFEDPSPMYDDMQSAVAILGGIFSAREFSTLGTQLTPNYSQRDYNQMVADTKEAMASEPNNLFRNTGKTVEVGISLPTLTVTLYPPKGAQDRDNEKALKIVQAYFPKFRMPTKWMSKVDEKTKSVMRMPVVADSSPQVMYTLEDLTRIKPTYTPGSGNRGPSLYPEISADYVPFAGVGLIQMEMVPKGVRSEDYEDEDETAKGGDITGSDFGVMYDIKLTGIMRFPMEYVLWATSTHTPDQFNPLPFWNLIQSRHTFYNTPKKGRRSAAQEPPERVADLGATYREYNRLLTVNKNVPMPKGNEDEMVITGTGQIVWVPQTDRVQIYLDQMKGAYDAATGTINPAAKIPGIANQPVFSEWVTDKFLYTNTIGRLEAVNLVGCRPLDKVTMLRTIRTVISDGQAKRFAQIIHEICEKHNLYAEFYKGIKSLPPRDPKRTANIGDGNLPAVPVDNSLEENHLNAIEMMNVIMTTPGIQITWSDLAAADFGASDEFLVEKLWCRSFTALVRSSYRFFDKIDVEFKDKMTWLRLAFVLLTKYTLPTEYGALINNYNDALRRNSEQPEIKWDPRKPLKIYNMPGLKGMPPHQVEAKGLLGTYPTGALIDVDPGGGKTTLGIIDICTMLGEGLIKRPLVIVPGKFLVRDWINEINRWTEGMINAFPITNAVYKRWKDNVGLTDEQIKDIISKQPVNTIFITDYNFLSKDRSEFQYENFWFDYMPFAIMMGEVGFDYVWMDESHRVKNMKSGRSAAADVVSSRTKYQRMASGTLIYNVASDLVGQVGKINPAIFYNKETFNARYAEDGKGVKISDEGRMAMMKAIQPYARKITLKRKEWAYLLPPIEEEFYRAVMTPKQKEFYDKLLDETLEEIKKDPKVMKLLNSGDPSAEAAIEEALKRYLIKLEIFINAPDSNYNPKQAGNVFKLLTNLKPLDLVSPKVALIDEICERHLKGGFKTVRQLNGKESQEKVAPIPGKILIFGFNKAVSKHIFEHMKLKGIAVHYTAGDMDALDKARYDDSVQILVADENSIKEGQNMQMFSRLIRLQTLWTPGEQEQALSRIIRPDVPDASGKTKYIRDRLYFDWIVVDNTLEIAKTARLVSKIVEKAKIDHGDNNDFAKMYAQHEDAFEEVQTITMNLDTIRDYSNFRDLSPSFDAYGLLKNWEDRQFKDSKGKLKAKLEVIYGRPIQDGELASLAMQRVDGTSVIPGSQPTPSYVPFVDGITPLDKIGLGLKALSEASAFISEDEDDDEEDEDDINDDDEDPVDEGMVIVTEFGPGYVAKVRKNSSNVGVYIPGFAKGIINIPRKIVFKPTNAKTLAQLTQQLKLQKAGFPTLKPPGGVPLNTPQMGKADPKNFSAPDSANSVPVKEPSKKEKPWLVPFHAANINGQLALMAPVGDDKNASKLVNRSWKVLGPTVGSVIGHSNAMGRLVDYFREKFTVPKSNQDELIKVQDLMKSKKNQLAKVKPKDYEFIRDFFRDNIRRAKDPKTELHPHVAFVDGQVMVLINIAMQPAARKLINKKIGQNVGRFEDFGDLVVKFFHSKAELKAELKTLAGMNILPEDAEELEEGIAELR